MYVSERYCREDQDDYERVDCGDLYVEEVVQVEDGERDEGDRKAKGEGDALDRIYLVLFEECEGPGEARDEQYEDRSEDHAGEG